MIDRILRSEFVRHNAIYLAAAVVVGGLNYLYYPVLGRLMDPVAFGEIQTLVSLFLQATAYLTVMGLVTVHIVANRSGSRGTNYLLSELEKLATLIGLAVLVLTLILSPLITRYFQFESGTPFALLAVALVVTVPYIIRSSYVNGKKLFGLNATSSIVGAGGKLLLSAGFVALGFGVVGAIGGIVVAQVIALVVAASFAKKHGFVDTLRQQVVRLPNLRLLAPELKYAGLVLVGSLSITILYSMDIIIVKHYFDPHTAGLYASVATVARILFFLTVPVSQVLMPSVKLQAKPRDNTLVLIKSGVLVTAITSVIVVCFWAAPKFIVTLLMGSTYQEYAHLLPRLGLAIGVISALNLITTYYMALRVYAIGALAASGVVATSILMHYRHGSLEEVVTSLLYGSLLTAGIYVVWIGLKSRRAFSAPRFINRTRGTSGRAGTTNGVVTNV
jgi:O-antigen/teichoic acid export membrane protein